MMKKSKNNGFGITETFEGILYYLSAMVGFNIIYALKIAGTNINDNKVIPCLQKNFFVALCILVLISIAIALYIVFFIDDEIKSESQEKGMKITITPNDNITSEIFFNSYSLFVITALSLPNYNNMIDVLSYLFVFITLGIIYISNEMFHINPTISLLGYKYYKISFNLESKSYTLMAPKNKITKKTTLNVKKKCGEIIKLK
ncbi:MAG: hypothetical protein VB047_06660 [Anaerotignum propionicum]|uniref:hypothetical protein n=1 Tax=Anaerotignum propionicum TaxID=28446 RepID=UPI002B1EC91D|nr:hypothetical protein [Anaerotignum propionicum]MEA5057223.1 hypothetical protein [Anaerotignum propionicum]